VFHFKTLFALRLKVASKADSRIRILSDIINGIRSIKMFTWEKPFAKLVENARKFVISYYLSINIKISIFREEMSEITKANFWRISSYACLDCYQKLSVFLCILIAVLNNESLTPQYVFALLIIYDTLRRTSQLWSSALINNSELMASLRRLEHFLLLDYEKSHTMSTLLEQSPAPVGTFVSKSEYQMNNDDQTFGVSLSNVTAKWDPKLSKSSLTDVTVTATSGKLVAVVGVAGGGKSTLLQVMLKEIPISSGNLSVTGSLSYTPQEPWVFTGTLRENIVFGEKMDNRKFQEVIKVCCLEHDISRFSYGVNTLVGEKGVMLSGGQKARVSLARAIYRDADVYLLDDPLSAVDVHVANRIFYECIRGYLRNKCVVLVTHQIQFLENVDKVILLEKGKVRASGSYNNIEGLIKRTVVEKGAAKDASANTTLLQECDLPSEADEDRGSGTLNPYKGYCLAGHGWTTTCLLVIFFAFTQLLVNLCDCSFVFWVDSKEGFTTSNTQIEIFFNDTHFLYVCGILLLIIIVACYSNLGAAVLYCKYASQYLHKALFGKVLVGSLIFFDNHPSGRVLNRFSKDMGMIDEVVPLGISELTKTILMTVGSLVILMVFNYWLTIPLILFFLLIVLCSVAFKPVISNIKRIEGTSKFDIWQSPETNKMF
jgi:ATP-binding cassette subfamily C (CFTR/MRP) protein 4